MTHQNASPCRPTKAKAAEKVNTKAKADEAKDKVKDAAKVEKAKEAKAEAMVERRTEATVRAPSVTTAVVHTYDATVLWRDSIRLTSQKLNLQPVKTA